MTNRERMVAVLERRAPDRIPFAPRLELWHAGLEATRSLPARYRGLSLRAIERELGVVSPARQGRIFTVACDGVEIREHDRDGRRITEYRTPVGSVRSVVRAPRRTDQAGMAPVPEEYVLKGPGDYRVWEYVIEATRWQPCYEQYLSYDREIGEDGLPFVGVGDVPFHNFLQKLAGYENAYFHLADEPALVEHLLDLTTRVEREGLWPVIAAGPARFLMHGMHLSSQITPPPLFERYILPYYEELMPLLHRAGKTVAMHADADLSLLLPLVERAGWDALECFVTAPMVPLTFERAREFFGSRMILWGGIPSVYLSPWYTEEGFRAAVRRVLRVAAPGDAFVLGVADNVMPDSIIERVEWISRLVESEGSYPLC
jgi:uroporphyrinogen-III decarboxylase